MAKRDGNDVFKGRPATMGMESRNVMKDDFGLEIPAETIPLPSNGLCYPEGHPLHLVETIDIRPMTAREEDILTSKALIKKGTVITELIKSCLIDKAIDPDTMISGDRNAVMTALRITGYGSDYTVGVTCPDCGEESKQEFDLAALPIKRLTGEAIGNDNLFEFELPFCKKPIQFKFMTGADEAYMQKMQNQKKKKQLGQDSLITDRYKHQVTSVAGITDKTKISFFIRNMPAKDSRALRNYMDEIEPGIEMKAWMDCPNCLETSEVRLPLGASFFWPDADA